jgi:arylformamidase
MPEPIDITTRLRSDMPTWPGSMNTWTSLTRSIGAGDMVNETALELNVHSGTHVEGPLHFIDGGVPLEAIPLGAFVGLAEVVAVPEAGEIGPDELESASIPDGAERLILRTRNSDERLLDRSEFTERFVALTVDGARWIADRGLRLVGIDYLSIQQFGGDPETHRVLMRAGVAILEGLDLAEVEPGPYRLTCLPLRLADAEAAPARAILERIP